MRDCLRRLWPELKVHRVAIFVVTFAAIVMGLTGPGVAILIETLFNDVFTMQNVQATWLFVFGIPLLFLIKSVFRYIQAKLIRTTAESIGARMRQKLLQKYLEMDFAFHSQSRSGSGGLMSRVLNDAQAVVQGVQYMGDLVREPIVALITVAAMFWVDWRLTVFILVTAPLLVFVIRRVSRSLRKYGHQSQTTLEDLTHTTKESLDGIRIIQSYNLESTMASRFDAELDLYLQQRNKIISREELTSPINEFLAATLLASFTYFQVGLMGQGLSTTGDYMAFLALAGFLQQPIKKALEAIARLQQTVVNVERIYGLLDQAPSLRPAKAARPFPKEWNTIEFKNVSFSYGDQPVLKNVHLTVRRGEQIALVGESGSGKSTLVNLLERFFDPTEGDILVDGVPLHEFSLTSLRHNIALVSQDVFLFHDTLENNIRAGKSSEPTRVVEEVTRKANAHTFIAHTPDGLQALAGDRGGRFSGGEKQRISIARALFKDAPILILDEATSALDSVSEQEVQLGLNSLMQNRTTFIIAHRLSTIRNADRIVVLEKGELKELGTHQELVEKGGLYASFARNQL